MPNFQGRIRRRTYWFGLLRQFGAAILVIFLSLACFIAPQSYTSYIERSHAAEAAMANNISPADFRVSQEADGSSSSPGGIDLAGAGAFAIVGALIAIGGTILILIYSIALHVKRFHDQNRSGLWYLLAFVPGVGSLIVLILCGFLPSSEGSNQYGADPAAA